MTFTFQDCAAAGEYFDRLRRQAIEPLHISGCDVMVPDDLDEGLYPEVR